MIELPSLFDWVDRLAFLRGFPAAAIILATAVLILVVWDWRITVAALAVQQFAAALLFTDFLVPRLAIAKLLTGWFICLILYFTARQVNWGRLPQDVPANEAQQLEKERRVRIGPYLLSTTWPFRFFLGCLMALVIWAVGQQPAFQLPILAGTFAATNQAVLTLVLLGLLILGLSLEPLKAGMGLLMVLTGFELFYSALEQSIVMLAALAVTNLVTALAMAYLTQARYTITVLIQD